MFILGLIFWGNLVDNTLHPRFILIMCESFIALSYLVYAGTLFFSSLFGKNEDRSFVLDLIRQDFELDVVSSAFRSGIMIVTAIQLFNWFPKKFYGTILSFCLLCSPLAFFLQFLIGGFY